MRSSAEAQNAEVSGDELKVRAKDKNTIDKDSK
jgi:hypothetical protein